MKQPAEISLGIDLGTTYSLAATLESGEPRVLRNRMDEFLIPSAVCVDEGGHVLVGAAALASANLDPGSAARWFKRDMGTDRSISLRGRQFKPEELSALVLKEVLATAEETTGCRVSEAVVTVPAYFGELQRRATRDACELAGLPVERIINEPTAAALAYGLHQRDRELRCAVLDLGGGTFDVTILEIFEGVIEIQSSAGDARLGGEDFADALTELLATQLRESFDAEVERQGRGWARLREAAEGLKRRLSSEASSRVALPQLPTSAGPRDVELEVSREQAEQVWAPLLQGLREPIRRSLNDAGIKPSAIDEVILVGGATRMPCVHSMAAQSFQRLPLRSLPPDEAVAMGAAVQVALKRGEKAVEDMVVTDIAPFSLGVAVADRIGSQTINGLFSPILERGTVLPASRVEILSTLADNQRQIEVEVFQGENSLCKHNTFLGKYEVSGIPPGPAGSQQIEVRLTYDLNGILEVDTTVLATKRTRSMVIEKTPGRLSKAQLAAARQQMAALKFHPRDALPNITALNRAEELHQELTGDSRAYLAEAMSMFRLCLQTQDPEQISQGRALLLKRLEELRQHLSS